MDTKGFVRDFDRAVKNISEDNDNWDGSYRTIAEYDSEFAKDFEKYLNEGQNKYSDKYFSKQAAELFADDLYQVDEYTTDIEKELGKLWKSYESNGGSKVKHNNDRDNNESLASRVLSTALDDGAEIATRIAAKQLARSIVEPATAMLMAGLDIQDESVRGKIAKFLSSDVGLGLASFVLSFGVEQLPLPALAQATIKNLGRELRVQGEMAIADPVVEMVGAPLRLMLTEKVLALPIPGLSDAKQLTQGAVKASLEVIDAEVEVIEVAPKKKTTKTKKPTKKPAKKSTKKPAKKSNSATEIKVTVKDSSKSDSVN